jgi:hypothetical protein
MKNDNNVYIAARNLKKLPEYKKYGWFACLSPKKLPKQ